MNEKTRRVFNGWLNLTIGERQELEAAIRRYNTSTESEQRQLRESTRSSVMKMDTGPLGTVCSCCGR
jgi:hypothetical protein